MTLGPPPSQRECITCGAIFTHGERRYGSSPYYGYYCQKHDMHK